ncbi:MAG TPA: CvpA family protein [Methylococcaceae bacterium]|nr:CvpA family protein [Methylococcaceae bacterium]
MPLIWIDYGILGLIALSAVVGLLRGFIREAFSLLVWIVAAWVGLTFSHDFAPLLEKHLQTPSVRIAAAFAALFLLTLVVGGLVGYLLTQLVQMTGFTGTDRLLGLLFGVARGALLVSVLVLLAGVTPLPNDPWWKESALIPPFQKLALWLREQLPVGLAGYVTYR